MTNRRGFTLVELLIALVLMSLLAASVSRVFNSQQRLAVSQVELASLQSNLRTGSIVAANELWELGSNAAGISDISSFNAGGLTYRAMRGLGLACQVSRTEVRVRAAPLFGGRAIVPLQDSLLLFVDRDPQRSTDDTWLARRITAVTNGSSCGGSPAVALTINAIDTLTTPLSAIITEAPIRTFEVMELRAVMVGSQYWLGARSVSGGQATLLPVAGPVTATGVNFAYFDATGNSTAVAGNIRSIRITLYGQSERAVHTLGSATVQPIRDSLITTVTLRNAPLP
jgi:prepilin-type N-terminal cleavage/methylation domain-containing protein